MTRPLTQIGRSASRIDGQAKVSGAMRYAADIQRPGMIWGRCLRSPYAHARIRSIDAAAARNIEGVFAILTANDLPRRLVGRRLKDMPVLAQQTVRFIGERVAVVAAQTPDVAEEALSRIVVDYEEMKSVHDPIEAMEGAISDGSLHLLESRSRETTHLR